MTADRDGATEQEGRTASALDRESANLLQAILDNTTAIIFVKDLQGRYVLINRRYEDLRGVRRADLVGKTAYDIMPREEADISWAHDSKVIEARTPTEWEEQFNRGGVMRTYVSLRFPLWDTAGQLFGVCGILTDITERKRAELELTSELGSLRTLVETSPVGVIVAEAEGERVVTVNREAERILGFPHRPGYGMQQYEGAFVRRRLDGSVYGPDELPIRRALHRGETVRSEEMTYEFPDGRSLKIRVNATPVYGEDGRITAAVAVIQDITPLQAPPVAALAAEQTAANSIRLELAGQTVRLEYGFIGERGQRREVNEDSVYCEPAGSARVQDDGWLCAVADGMGGAAVGEVASKLAVETLADSYYASLGGSSEFADAVRRANGVVYETAQQNPRYSGMGTTLTAALIRGDRLTVGHVGDSRAYLVRQGSIRQLTNDHSWVAELVRAGALSPDHRRNLPISNLLTRALGRALTVEIDLVEEELQPGDSLVLCSDGVSNNVVDAEIARAVATERPQEAARALVSLARQRGGGDDTTVAIATLRPLASSA